LFATAFGVPNAGPTGVFDDAYGTLWAITDTIFQNTPVSWTGGGLGTIIATALIFVAGVVCLVVLFLPYLAVIFLLLLMVVIGPVAILAALFKVLDRWLIGYVDVIATLALSMLAIDIVVALYQSKIVQLLTNFVPTNAGDKDIPAFGGIVLILFVMAFTVWRYLLPLVSRVFGGVGLAMDAGAVFLASQASRVVRFATR
jgi:hypothetical protein